AAATESSISWSSTVSPAGRRSHSARSAAGPRARAAESRYPNVGIAGARPAQRGADAAGRDEPREHRLLDLRDGTDGADDRLGNLLGAGDDGRDEEDDQGGDARVRE